VAHGEDFGRLALHAVDHAVVSDDDLADVGAVEFADNGAGFGEVGELFNGSIDLVSPVDDRRPVLAFLCENGGETPLALRFFSGISTVPSSYPLARIAAP